MGLQLWDKQEARACGVDTLAPFEVKDKLLPCSVVHPICKMVVVMLGKVLAPCQKITVRKDARLGIRRAFNF